MVKEFYDLSYRGRALRLRRVALAALDRYELRVARLRLLTNETNGIFRVDTAGGKRHVVRVTDPLGCHGLEEIRSEMMWLAALRRDTYLGVPDPLTNREGEFVTTVETAGVPEARHCAVFSWVLGPDLAERLSAENVYRLGVFTALLHHHAKSFAPPEAFCVRRLDKVFPYATPGFSRVEPVVIFDEAHRDLFPRKRREVYRCAADRAQDALDRLYTDQGGLRVLHNDLHQWNVKVYRGKLYALDFEDLAWGYPVQDIATTLFYFQGHERREELYEAYRCGYQSHEEWPEAHSRQIETLIAARGVMLVNYLVSSSNPEDQRMAPDYVARVEGRLRRFLDGDGCSSGC